MRWQKDGKAKTNKPLRADNGYSVARKGPLWVARTPAGKPVLKDDGEPLTFRTPNQAMAWVENRA